ncbi:DUF420 domain-containing protein [Haloarchaeobius iranensis]|uniref:Putative membrane protein n=1 Tax=Haloarchaeobius iranensis TaxID=996166 RepID=A0A1G9Z5H8_9EURY|nr:DUF420 domain-containing protein [Haloarchaeobius iranensis]SDN16652.1 putative membrane protein [Haloarchaeobius iranensis]
MQQMVKRNVPAVTAVLSIVSLALVFGAARQLIPKSLLPAAPDWLVSAIPHVNAVISVVAVVVILAGLRAIKQDRWDRHRKLMGTGVVLFVIFLALYLYKVALKGPNTFPGSGVAELAYLAILAIHMILAIACIPLLYYVLLLAVTRPMSELSETVHPKIGRIAAPLWLISFVLGTVVYVMLYLVPASAY